MTGLRCVWTVPLPGGNVGEAVVVTLGLSLGGLVFLFYDFYNLSLCNIY